MTSPKRELPAPGVTESYPVLPLRDIVVFPHMIVPLFVGREKTIRALEEVMKTDKSILLATQKNAAEDDPEPEAVFSDGHARQRAAIAETARRHGQGAGRRHGARKSVELHPHRRYYEAEAEALPRNRPTRSRPKPWRVRWPPNSKAM